MGTKYNTFYDAVKACDTTKNSFAIADESFTKAAITFVCSDDLATANDYVNYALAPDSTMFSKIQSVMDDDSAALDNYCILAGKHIGKLYRYNNNGTPTAAGCVEDSTTLLITAEGSEDKPSTLSIVPDSGFSTTGSYYKFDVGTNTEALSMTWISPNSDQNNSQKMLTTYDSDGISKNMIEILCGVDGKFVRTKYNAADSDYDIKECVVTETGDADKECQDATGNNAYYDRFTCEENSSSALLSAFMLVTSLTMFLF